MQNLFLWRIPRNFVVWVFFSKGDLIGPYSTRIEFQESSSRIQNDKFVIIMIILRQSTLLKLRFSPWPLRKMGILNGRLNDRVGKR